MNRWQWRFLSWKVVFLLSLALPIYSGVLWCRETGTFQPFKLHNKSGLNREIFKKSSFYLTFQRGLETNKQKTHQDYNGVMVFKCLFRNISIRCTKTFHNLCSLNIDIPHMRRKSTHRRKATGCCQETCSALP